jgi:MFS transporter, DHA2 family, multidrug resistance protein
VAISAALEPTLAALILSVARWPWLFLVNVPVGLIAVPLFLAVALGEFAAGLGCGALLVWQQSRRVAPLLPLDLLRIPLIALSVGTSICSYAERVRAWARNSRRRREPLMSDIQPVGAQSRLTAEASVP